MLRIKKNDTVIVLAGKDKNKKGTVIELALDKSKVKVKDVAVMTKHKKARRQGQESSIKKEEGFIDLSNVMLICNACSKPCRTNFEVREDDRKVRVCNRCKEII